MRALPQRHCRISIAVTQTCVQALSLLSAHNTVHTFPLPVIAQKLISDLTSLKSYQHQNAGFGLT